MITCPHCGGEIWGSEDQIVAWRTECTAKDWPIKAGRVSETTASALLGISVRKLAELRKHGSGPVVSSLPVAGSRYSYDLKELAQFKEAMKSGEAWLPRVA